jgi:hypothetical protein
MEWILAFKRLAVPLCLYAFMFCASAAELTIRLLPNEETNFLCYVAYVGNSNTSFAVIQTTNCAITFSNLFFGNDYLFAVTAVDNLGVESFPARLVGRVPMEYWITNTVLCSTNGSNWAVWSTHAAKWDDTKPAIMFRPGGLTQNRWEPDRRVLGSNYNVTTHTTRFDNVMSAPPLPR